MTQHTPGPWVQGKEDDFKGIAITTPARGMAYVAIANVPVDYTDRPEREANARLIAAAPELLEAAKAVAQWCMQRPPIHPYDGFKMLEAAIAKAEGRT